MVYQGISEYKMRTDTASKDKYGESQERTEISVAVMQNDVGYIKAKIEEMNKKFDVLGVLYATKADVQMLKMIVYGMCGTILMAVIYTILTNLGLKVH
jgi:hypothetical protein